MKKLLHASQLAVIALFIAACQGSADDTEGNGNGTGGDNSDDGSATEPMVRIGSFDTSGTFNEGVIGANVSDLRAGESANLSVSLVDETEEPTEIFFSSPCAGTGTSEIDPAIVSNSSGTVDTTYTARGCDGDDPVTARTDIDGTTLTATVTLQTEPAPVGSIQFDSATNQLIGLEGTGALPEQSTVTFLVTNSSGGPVSNKEVTFKLNTSVGGIELSNDRDTTDADGRVSTTIDSGTQATTVRVTASTTRNDGTAVEAQSSQVAITTGIPDNDSFSLSAETLNIEGNDFDGEQVEVTIRAADRFNNPVPDGTSVNFTTEGGSIEGNCVTANGACSVTFTTQDPRPADGRATVLATAIGEESFTDTNPSNGRFDQGENFSDLREAFRDDDEDGIRDGDEPFIDFDSDGSHDGPSGDFTGLLCNDPSFCDQNNTLTVFENLEVVMSGSSLNIEFEPKPIDLTNGAVTVEVEVVDNNDQVPPAGTTLSASTTQGSIEGPTSFEVPNTNDRDFDREEDGVQPYFVEFSVAPGDMDGEGTFSIEVTTPNNVISRNSAEVCQGSSCP